MSERYGPRCENPKCWQFYPSHWEGCKAVSDNPIRSGESFTIQHDYEFTEEWLFEHFQTRDPSFVDRTALLAALMAERQREAQP